MDIMIEKFKNFIIGRISESADQDSDRHLAVAVDADGNGAGRIRFQFDPGTAVRNQLRAVNFLVESIFFLLVVHARGADQLGYDDTFGAIDDECTGIGHNREIAHVFVMLLQFAGFLVFQTYLYCERRRIVDVFLLALFNVVIRLPEGIIAKVKRPFVCTVFNWGNICKNVFQPFPAEPFCVLVVLMLRFPPVALPKALKEQILSVHGQLTLQPSIHREIQDLKKLIKKLMKQKVLLQRYSHEFPVSCLLLCLPIFQ